MCTWSSEESSLLAIDNVSQVVIVIAGLLLIYADARVDLMKFTTAYR